jgi:hypothetical protein
LVSLSSRPGRLSRRLEALPSLSVIVRMHKVTCCAPRRSSILAKPCPGGFVDGGSFEGDEQPVETGGRIACASSSLRLSLNAAGRQCVDVGPARELPLARKHTGGLAMAMAAAIGCMSRR